MKSAIACCIVISPLLFLAGCSAETDTVSAEVMAQRQQYLMTEEPAGAIGVLEAREENVDLTDVVLHGKVGGGSPTFQKGRAAFVITDPTSETHAHGDGHDHSNCAFCKAKKDGNAPLPIAIVQIVDENDEVLKVDARDLLGVDLEQLIVVKGPAEIDAIGNLTVRATGVHIR